MKHFIILAVKLTAGKNVHNNKLALTYSYYGPDSFHPTKLQQQQSKRERNTAGSKKYREEENKCIKD